MGLLIALLIKLDSPGPVIYRQLRVGIDRRQQSASNPESGLRRKDLGGRPFQIYKFRTMRARAESDSGPIWADRFDSRATRVGRVLRRTRLDELPQFWNVLKGDMSIVGPRPERPHFVAQLRDEIEGYQLRHRILPGITGWAQVHRGPDRSLDDVREKVRLDLDYLRRRSVRLDLWIMFLTAVVILRPGETAPLDPPTDR